MINSGKSYQPRRWSDPEILLLSVLILFAEMMFIRWIGTEIRIFSYIQNSVLVVCFLGLGLGCSGRPRRISPQSLLLPSALLVFAVANPGAALLFNRLTLFLSSFEGNLIWYPGSIDSSLNSVGIFALSAIYCFVTMVLLFDVFVALGGLLAEAFRLRSDVTRAYSANIIGSLAGTWVFALLGFWLAPPLVWGAVFIALIAAVFGAEVIKSPLYLALSAAILVMFSAANLFENSEYVIWSPYQKLAFQHTDISPGARQILVNNVGYQTILDLSPENIANHPEAFDPSIQRISHYEIPYRFFPEAKRILILGAGTGNDAAGALRNHAEEVVAVDIDPVIIQIGRSEHKERPYSSPQVQIVNDDARRFLASSPEKFDLVIFGLLDAHTSTVLTNVRLDHYMYTKEAIEQARRLLSHDGVLVLSFGMSADFLIARINGVITSVFGNPPLVFDSASALPFGFGGTMFVATNGPRVAKALENDRQLRDHVEQGRVAVSAAGIEPSTDDWPYLYLPGRHIPSAYYFVGVLICAIYLFRSRRIVGQLFPEWAPGSWHMFFLGAAFLMLEALSITRAALAFGNTWLVNAIIISGLLLMVLLANFVSVAAPKIPRTFCYLAVLGMCCGLYTADMSWFLGFGTVYRTVMVTAILTLPVFFSGIIFIQTFSSSPSRDRALGANLLGSLAGGMLQSLTLVLGIKYMFLLVAAFYAAAALADPIRQKG